MRQGSLLLSDDDAANYGSLVHKFCHDIGEDGDCDDRADHQRTKKRDQT